MADSHEEVIVLTTVADRDQAAAFGRGAVEQRVAACVNCIPGVFSFFRWETENVGEEAELLLLIKTTRSKLPALEHYFDAEHPYEVPEFVVLKPETVSAPYSAWLRSELKLDRP